MYSSFIKVYSKKLYLWGVKLPRVQYLMLVSHIVIGPLTACTSYPCIYDWRALLETSGEIMRKFQRSHFGEEQAFFNIVMWWIEQFDKV